MRKPKGAGDRLAWLGGADLEVLDQVPHERARFVQMAIVLLTTSGIGTLSMMFALHDGVHVALTAAVVGGLVWGFIILNLDRFLVLSMGHTRDWKRLLLMALPRLALAAVISVVVATPLTLRIFASDINNQMMIAHATESTQIAKAEQGTAPAQELAKVNKDIANDQAILNGKDPNVVNDDAVQTDQDTVNKLQAQETAEQTATNAAYDKWQCEIGGAGSSCANGASKLVGNGVRAQNDQRAYNQDQAQLSTLKTQLAQATQQLQADQKTQRQDEGTTLALAQQGAKQDLAVKQQQAKTLQSQISAQEQSQYDSINSDNGILSQLQNLSAAGARDPVLGAAQWVVTLLFFCIEILPVMVKVLLNVGPLSTYEVVLKSREEMITDAAKLKQVTRRRDIERESQKQIAIDEDMRQREEELGKHANEHVAAHMRAVLDAALAQWSRQVATQLNIQPPQAAPGTAGPFGANGTPGGGSYDPSAHGMPGSQGAPPQRGITAPQPRLGLTGPQPRLNTNGANGANGNHGPNGAGGTGYEPTVTWTTPPGGGYGLPDDRDLL